MMWFKKEKEKEKIGGDIKISKTVPRPVEYNYDFIDVDKKQKIIDRMKDSENGKIDKQFLQSIIDKALGPNGEEYISKLIDLNNEFPSRKGRTGTQIYED